jgi:hypothetical protein
MSDRELPPVTIVARQHNNPTGIQLEGGATYELAARGTWFDASIECGPDGHDEPKPRKFRFLRRSRPNLWFALMADVSAFSSDRTPA